jgi:hypothetical protein
MIEPIELAPEALALVGGGEGPGLCPHGNSGSGGSAHG